MENLILKKFLENKLTTPGIRMLNEKQGGTALRSRINMEAQRW